MVRTQIYLTEDERRKLSEIAQRKGMKQSELIREAIDSYVSDEAQNSREEIVRRTAGIWKERSDLPDFDQIRAEWDRSGAGHT